jgi:hypothetical protein
MGSTSLSRHVQPRQNTIATRLDPAGPLWVGPPGRYPAVSRLHGCCSSPFNEATKRQAGSDWGSPLSLHSLLPEAVLDLQ